MFPFFTVPNSLQDIMNWFLTGITISIVLDIVVFLLSIYVVSKLAKKYIVQLMLLIPVWLTSIIISLNANFTLIPYMPLQPGLATYILFPYTWDLLSVQYNSLATIMIIVSYVAFVHAGLLACIKLKMRKIWSLVLGYFMLITLGLGMINFQTSLVNSYVQSCVNAGVPPIALPVAIGCLIILTLMVFKFGFRKPEIKK